MDWSRSATEEGKIEGWKGGVGKSERDGIEIFERE